MQPACRFGAPTLRPAHITPKMRRSGPAYNSHVARGWESKSVESQQDDAKSTPENRARLTPEQRSIASRKEGLELSRSRVLEQLRSAENPRYRKLLEESLAMLDQQITQLG